MSSKIYLICHAPPIPEWYKSTKPVFTFNPKHPTEEHRISWVRYQNQDDVSEPYFSYCRKLEQRQKEYSQEFYKIMEDYNMDRITSWPIYWAEKVLEKLGEEDVAIQQLG